MGGLDDKTGYKNLSDQVELVKKGLRTNYQIFPHRYTDKSGVIESIKKYPNSKIILFSAAGSSSKSVAETVKNLGGELSNIYIVEPFYSTGSSGRVSAESVRAAVNMGVPASNVYTGNYMAAGLGIVNGASLTPNCSPTHWCALTQIASLIN